DREQLRDSHAYLAHALFGLGELGEARDHFAAATALQDGRRLYSLRGIWEAELRLALGDRAAARELTTANRALAPRGPWARDVSLCGTLLGLLALPEDPRAARERLEAARGYGSGSGHVEVQLRCYHLACEIARAERAHDLARAEAQAGIHLADTCGFGLYA